MSLQVWLPLNGNLNNQGLSEVTITNSGATVNSSGKIGSCYSFNGSNNKIQISNAPKPNNISVAMWFKRNATTNTRQFLYTQWQGITLELDGSNKITCSINTADGQVGHCNTTTTITTDSGWTHIVYTFEQGVGTKLYINGLFIQSASVTKPIVWSNNAGNIGYYSTYFNGCVNDFRIYDHCLSDKEVKEISKGLVLHYKLSGVSNPNLIITNSMAQQSGTSGWSSAGTGWANSLVDSPEAIGGKAIRCTYSGTTQTSGGIHHPTGNTKGDLTNGAVYTLSARIRASKSCRATFKNELHTTNNVIDLTTDWEVYSFSSTINNDNTYHSNVIYVVAADATQNMWIECNWIKLEEGDKATPWIPISTDPLYNKLGLNDSIEYDCSGYGNNGTKNNITVSSDSARYVSSYVFNGSNAYIKTNDSLWRSDGATELSINFWASMDDWTTFNARLYSCTESGGYNVEPSGSNVSFSMNAYTDATKSAYKYINDGGYCAVAKSSLSSGWHMFTYVYSTSSTKLYVDGALKINNTYTSYGVHYNATAPLIIGAEATGSGSTSPYFNGKMSDFKLFYTALSADDIKDLYQVSASVDNIGNLYAYEVVEQ